MSVLWRPLRSAVPGDLVGVCAPAGPVDPEALEAGVAELRRHGFEVRLSPGVWQQTGFTAGSPALRAAELQALLADESVDAIVCARGGAGAIQVLPLLEAARLPDVAKPLVGYSDVTLVHLWLHRAGWPALHGPMVARDLASGAYDDETLLAALAGEHAIEHDQASGLRGVRDGAAQGMLLGGCLSLLAASAGTAWALDPEEPTILFIEDVNEPAYRIDRLIRQMRHAGMLRRVVGVVLGQMLGCAQEGALPNATDIILDVIADPEVPVAAGLRSGHVTGANLTLPLGCSASLWCEGGAAVLTLDPAGDTR